MSFPPKKLRTVERHVFQKKREIFGGQRALIDVLRFIRNGMKVPSGSKMKSVLVEEYYKLIQDQVRSHITNILREGYATLMFDSSNDRNGPPVTNVLVRVMSTVHYYNVTFFLQYLYSGTSRTNSSYYLSIANSVLDNWLDREKVVVIVTDNTGNVKNAQESFMHNTFRAVASKDQAHVADLVMQDIGELQWIKRMHNENIIIGCLLPAFAKSQRETFRTECHKKRLE